MIQKMARHLKFDQIPFENLGELIQRKFVYGESIMLSELRLTRGAKVPLHSHQNEQVTYILKGVLRFWIGSLEGEIILVKSGEVLHLPSHLSHEVEALENTIALDLFSPPREDWINKEDDYLRG